MKKEKRNHIKKAIRQKDRLTERKKDRLTERKEGARIIEKETVKERKKDKVNVRENIIFFCRTKNTKWCCVGAMHCTLLVYLMHNVKKMKFSMGAYKMQRIIARRTKIKK